MKASVFKKLTPPEKSKLIGDIVLLMAASKVHREFPIVDVMDVVLPPIDLDQFRIYHNAQNVPIGLVCWGFFDEDVLKRYLSGDVVLTHEEWSKGKTLVFTDLIAPYGHAKRIVQELRADIFPKETGYSIRFDVRGKPRKKLRLWRGRDA